MDGTTVDVMRGTKRIATLVAVDDNNITLASANFESFGPDVDADTNKVTDIKIKFRK
jgi:hypothetical protein